MKITMVLAAGVLLVAACTAAPPGGPAATSPGQATPPSTPTITPVRTLPTEETLPPEQTPPPDGTLPPFEGDVPIEIMQSLVDEASAQAGVGLGDVQVIRAEAVTWRDGSLGCPDPDMVYTQALVDGFWVVLEAGGQTFDFRLGESGPPVLCPEGRGEPPLDEPY